MKAKVFLKIAWRNVQRNRRRSLITIAAISLGLASLIFFGAINDGFNEQMVRSSVRLMIGHIQIHRQGYQDDPDVEKFITHPDRYMAVLKDLPYPIYYAPRVKFQGLISSPENSYGVYVVGIAPAAEATVSTINRAVIEGKFLNNDGHLSHSLLLGKQLAKNLKTGIGDKVVLMTQAYDGSLSASAFTIQGIFRTGNPEMDKGAVYIPIEAAQSMLAYEDKISEIVILTDREEQVNKVKELIMDGVIKITQGTDAAMEILEWSDIAPDIVQIVKINDITMYILLGILFIIVTLGIINTLLMSIFERTWEIGIIMAIGTSPGYVVLMLIMEAMFLGFIGIILGLIIGVFITGYYNQQGIDLSKFSEGLALYLGLETTLYPVIKLKSLAIYTLAIFLTTILASLYPAVKAAWLRPIEAIRHV